MVTKQNNFTLALSDDEQLTLKALSEKNKVSKSGVIRSLILNAGTQAGEKIKKVKARRKVEQCAHENSHEAIEIAGLTSVLLGISRSIEREAKLLEDGEEISVLLMEFLVAATSILEIYASRKAA